MKSTGLQNTVLVWLLPLVTLAAGAPLSLPGPTPSQLQGQDATHRINPDPSDAANAEISVDPAESFQTIDGFGASDAWQCQFVGKNWPLAKRKRIADLLFSRDVDAQGNPKGIGLSIWRFNIGAGTAEQGDGSDIGDPWRRAECFLQSDGSYDWSKQAGQQWFLRAAHDRGVDRFLAFVNSPPVYFTRNGKGYAPKGTNRLNIEPDKQETYTAFLVNVMAHFAKAGLGFDYLSPVNEPQWAWDSPGQEGSPALNEDIYKLVRYLVGRSVGARIEIESSDW